jgi:3-isopropylmalate/(R)-2-methylmalate dehydratase small subunit
MDKFISHTGSAIALRRSNVDTDQIIPAVYLKRITKSGFEDGLFAAWRSDPDFELNQSKYQGATILVAGPDFGTGSSREHAVWALQNYGFKVVLSSRFADIFRGNSQKAGLLTVILTQNEIEEIWQAIEKDATTQIKVDLDSRSVEFKDLSGSQRKLNFEIDDYTRWRLMEGLDDIGLTMTKIEKVENFEKARAKFKPQTLPVKS